VITTVGNLVGGTVFVAPPFHLVANLQQPDR
jgi:formate/nitrite transporter FocA (FNT family)